MAMMGVDDFGLPADSRGQVSWLGLRVGGHLALGRHSSNEPSELLQWPHHDDSTINIVVLSLVL